MAIDWFSVVQLDRMFILTGSYGAPNTTWTLPDSVVDNTLDKIVLGPDFGSSFGQIIDVLSSVSGTVTAAGDYSAGDVAIGRTFPMSVEMTRPFVRDGNGFADPDAFVGIRQFTASYVNTGALQLRSSMTQRSDRTKSIDVDPIQGGQLKAWFNGRADLNRLFIENNSPKPSVVPSVEYIVDYEPRMG